MKSILVVDFTEYQKELAGFFPEKEFRVEPAESAFEAMSLLETYDFDLVISEVDLPGDNSFDLYNYIRNNYPYIPAIMVTDRDMDSFFDRIFKEGIGNVLSKPIDSRTLRRLADKLMNRENIFGLKNYMSDLTKTRRIRLTSSNQIPKAVPKILDEIESWGFNLENRHPLTLVLHEMIINAVYHSHGLSREKMERKAVVLPEGQYVDILMAHNKREYGISITDYNGRLSREVILQNINKVVEQTNLIIRSFETGEDVTDRIAETGRGIDMVRKLGGDYYFVIQPNVRTEILMIFDPSGERFNDESRTSLKIIEDTRPHS